MISAGKKALLASTLANRGGAEPIGIDLDGVNDYGSLGVDLTGNADGKTFTFSCWLYYEDGPSASGRIYHAHDGSLNGIYFQYTDHTIDFVGFNSAGTTILNVTGTHNDLPRNTWFNVIISLDISNASNRYIYVNDEDKTSNWTFTTYTNDTIDFTKSSHTIGATNTGAAKYKGRLAGLYLDYTYRDLSDSANRRLFIDAEGRYVTPPTSGIISMPMDDPTNPYRNDGTGQNFTANGTVARSGRGPNQYNPAASTFDGSADKLTISSITGAADGKAVTVAFTVKFETLTGTDQYHIIGTENNANFRVLVASNKVRVNAAPGADAINMEAAYDFVIGKYYTIALSFNLTDTGQRAIEVNGADQTLTVSVYSDINMTLTAADWSVARNTSRFTGGELSDVWFDDSYTADLSGFYDADTGKAKDLGTDGSTPTGSQPLIYLPMRGDDAGNNLGSGGDFTVNSGPLLGGRGPNEFWAESAEFNGTNQYLRKTGALTGATDGKVFSFACAFYMDSITDNNDMIMIGTGTGNLRLFVRYTNGGRIECFGFNSAGTTILRFDEGGSPMPLSLGAWHTILISIDLTNSSNRYMYVDDTLTTPTWDNYTNDNLEFSTTDNTDIGQDSSNTNFFDGKIGFLWFNTEYIDFSQESNRLKFFDAFGYPVDMGADGSLVTGTAPLIYMNEGFHLGTNLGTGGNFTPNNAPTDGGFVRG
jgi:hypothetical protein